MTILPNQRILLCFVCLLSAAGTLHSYDLSTGSAPFETSLLHKDAQSMGMGNCVAGLTNDINGVFYNPATIATLQRPHFALSYVPLILDIFSTPAAFAAPVAGASQKKHIVGGFCAYHDLGTIQERTISNSLTGHEWYSYACNAGVNWAYEIFPKLSFGMSLKGMYEQQHSSDGRSYAAVAAALDAGAQYSFFRSQLVWGVILRNLGMIGDPYKENTSSPALPVQVISGIAFTPRELSYSRITLDISKVIHYPATIHTGGELLVNPVGTGNYTQVFLRGGFMLTTRDLKEKLDFFRGTSNEMYEKGTWTLFTAGIGIDVPITSTRHIDFDFAYQHRANGISPGLTFSLATML